MPLIIQVPISVFIPSDTLKYRAEIHATEEIASPGASDFSGATWVKYIGDDGATGPAGADGEDGQSFTVDATGLLSEKSTYDAELEGFAFLATDTGDIYIKNSDTSGDWSNALSHSREIPVQTVRMLSSMSPMLPITVVRIGV